MTVSDRIELLREKNGISLTHLNSVIGAYRGKLTEVRKGKASLSNAEISILAQALSTSTDYLLGNTDDPTPAGQKEGPLHSQEVTDSSSVVSTSRNPLNRNGLRGFSNCKRRTVC